VRLKLNVLSNSLRCGKNWNAPPQQETPAPEISIVKQQLLVIVDNDVQLGKQLIKEATIWEFRLLLLQT